MLDRYKPCCDDPTVELRCLIGSPACCPNGIWTCPDGLTGLYPSDLLNPDGPRCDNGCCELEATPDCGGLEPACCPEGSWTCPAKEGGYVCRDSAFVDPPGGQVCSDCCPRQSLVACFTGGASCCSEETWVCPDADSGLYNCGGVLVKETKGKPCSACCDPVLKPPGPFPCTSDELGCCPDGTWTCNMGDGKTFACGGELVVNPQGEICSTTVTPPVCCTVWVERPLLGLRDNTLKRCLVSINKCRDSRWIQQKALHNRRLQTATNFKWMSSWSRLRAGKNFMQLHSQFFHQRLVLWKTFASIDRPV